jgi:hypothetical protein
VRFFLSLKKTNLQNAVAFCLSCFKPLDTHKSIVHAYNKKDDKKYKDVYTFCESCILENSDKYEQTPIEETIIE